MFVQGAEWRDSARALLRVSEEPRHQLNPSSLQVDNGKATTTNIFYRCHFRRHALDNPQPKVTSITHHPVQHSFTLPPPPPPPPTSPAPLLSPATSNPAASFADFLLNKVKQNGEQQNMKLEKAPLSIAPPSPRPSSRSSFSSTNTLEEAANGVPQSETKSKIKTLEDMPGAAGPPNMTKLDALQLDLEDYEKLLRAKMHKNLRYLFFNVDSYLFFTALEIM